MKTNNVVLDFTQINSPAQDVAVMPANLAKKLLAMHANNLHRVPFKDIVHDHISELDNCPDMDKAIQCSIDFVQERQLINNIVAENWDAYSVKSEEVVAVVDEVGIPN